MKIVSLSKHSWTCVKGNIKAQNGSKTSECRNHIHHLNDTLVTFRLTIRKISANGDTANTGKIANMLQTFEGEFYDLIFGVIYSQLKYDVNIISELKMYKCK